MHKKSKQNSSKVTTVLLRFFMNKSLETKILNVDTYIIFFHGIFVKFPYWNRIVVFSFIYRRYHKAEVWKSSEDFIFVKFPNWKIKMIGKELCSFLLQTLPQS